MKTDTWMPLYIGDYLKDTMHLSRSEHGSYILMIMAYWANGGPIPDDDEDVRNIVKCPTPEWPRTRGILQRFFQVDNGLWTHRRIDGELRKAGDNQAAQKARTEAARAAKLTPKPVTSHVTTPVTSHVTTSPSPSPSPSPVPTPEPLPFNPPIGGVGGNWNPSAVQKRFNALFRRRDQTPWSKRELKAFEELGEIDNSDLELVEKYYAASFPKDKDIRRRDMLTLLNNFRGEVDRANAHKPRTCL